MSSSLIARDGRDFGSPFTSESDLRPRSNLGKWGRPSALEQSVSTLCLCLGVTQEDRAGSLMRAIEIFVFRTGFLSSLLIGLAGHDHTTGCGDETDSELMCSCSRLKFETGLSPFRGDRIGSREHSIVMCIVQLNVVISVRLIQS